jgi:hypothetical protein
MQNRSCKTSPITEKRDTVTVYKHIVDTFYTKPLPPKIIKDTIWLKNPENTPDTTYNGLLNQYTILGNKYFETKIYNTPFSLGEYGSIIVKDSIKENSLIGSSIITNLKIPTTTITIEKTVPYRALYIGPEVTGNKNLPINGLYGRAILKTKNDHLYSISGGWNGEWQIGGGMYWRLKFRK